MVVWGEGPRYVPGAMGLAICWSLTLALCYALMEVLS